MATKEGIVKAMRMAEALHPEPELVTCRPNPMWGGLYIL